MTREEFIARSQRLNLFWMRIMKEHCVFLIAGLPPVNKKYAQAFGRYQNKFDSLLNEVIKITTAGQGEAPWLDSGAFVTEYTLQAEKATSDLTGIPINTALTTMEVKALAGLNNNEKKMSAAKIAALYDAVKALNAEAAKLTDALADTQQELLDAILKGDAFSGNYPAVYQHMNAEAAEYINNLELLAALEPADADPCLFGEFWSRNMFEHAVTERGLLDPSEDKMFARADTLGRDFTALYASLGDACANEISSVPNGVSSVDAELAKTRAAMAAMKAFNLDTVNGILDAKLKSIIPPLLADHLLRESNYYIMLLKG